MRDGLSSVLGVLAAAGEGRAAGCRRACALLPTGLALTRVLLARVRGPDPRAFDAFLRLTVGIVGRHQARASVTDWPFEHFWDNPYEPRHSKLLGYFLNPREGHGCGSFLLGSLLTILQARGVLPSSVRFPVVGCEVYVEKDNIDVLISRRATDGTYALIFENKVNGAKDQPGSGRAPGQLSKYGATLPEGYRQRTSLVSMEPRPGGQF